MHSQNLAQLSLSQGCANAAPAQLRECRNPLEIQREVREACRVDVTLNLVFPGMHARMGLPYGRYGNQGPMYDHKLCQQMWG